MQNLKEKLEEIESRRVITPGEGLFHRVVPEIRVNPLDQEKVQVIREFELPETLEELADFMNYAAANVDLSQYEDWNSLRTVSKKAVSDAWVEKMRLAFSKAEAFNTPENEELYKQIRRKYVSTVGRLDDQKKRSRVFSIGFPLALICLLLLVWFLLLKLG